MVAGQNGTIMEVAVKLAEVEVNSAQEVVITLHHRTMERTVQGRHPNLENVIHKDAQSMVVGRNGVVTEVAVSLVEVEDKPGQEAVLTPHQRTMVKLAPDLLLNPELVIHKDARSMEVGRNGVAMEVAVALAEVEVKPVLEAVLTLHQRTMEKHVQGQFCNPESVTYMDALSMEVGQIGVRTEIALVHVEEEFKSELEAVLVHHHRTMVKLVQALLFN